MNLFNGIGGHTHDVGTSGNYFVVVRKLGKSWFNWSRGWDIIDAWPTSEHLVTADSWLLVANRLREFEGFCGSTIDHGVPK